MAQPSPADLPARIAEKIQVDENGCWIWQACLHKAGYGKVYFQGRVDFSHRATWTLLVDPIPEGLVIDHVCRVRACCNPTHLRVCTHRENILAPRAESPAARRATQTHCEHGHELSGSNVYIRANGCRACRACHRDWERAARRRRPAA